MSTALFGNTTIIRTFVFIITRNIIVLTTVHTKIGSTDIVIVTINFREETTYFWSAFIFGTFIAVTTGNGLVLAAIVRITGVLSTEIIITTDDRGIGDTRVRIARPFNT
jgi:hypothetical protein